MKDYHPSPDLLKRFVCSTLDPGECRLIVRHLLTGCPTCQEVTRRLLEGRPDLLPELARIVDWRP